MPMLNIEFQINLSEPIKQGKVTIGYFDGIHPSIVAVTRSDKIFVHNPHNRSVYDPKSLSPTASSNSVGKTTENVGLRLAQHTASTVVNDINFLNINQTITCVGAGSISSLSLNNSSNHNFETHLDIPNSNSSATEVRASVKQSSNHDILVIGTETSIHAYDVLHNTDLYYKEIPDGANAIVIGEFGSVTKDGQCLALIGGNCAIHGFDRNGNDSYWMVTGDNITAMALVDFDGDHQNELIVGSQDCEIQVFKKDAIIAEINETDRVTHLCSLGDQLFAYALANGTVGVYQKKERLWRIKSKNQPMTLLGADINNNGQMELLTGWSNGKLDIRIAMTGEVLYRENFKNSVAGLMISDYNMDGQTELIVCTVNGDVHGYRLDNQQGEQPGNQALVNVNLNIEQETIRELMKKRQTLLQELRNYEENARIKNLADPVVMNKGKVLTEKGDHFGAIPANTKLKSSLILQSYADGSLPDHIELRLETTNYTRIRAAIIFAEGIFKHESIVVYPLEQEVTNGISVPLRPPKDVPVDMHVKTLVGSDPTSTHYHVFELSRRLPRFAMYSFIQLIYLNEGKENGQLDKTVQAQRDSRNDINNSSQPQNGKMFPLQQPDEDEDYLQVGYRNETVNPIDSYFDNDEINQSQGNKAQIGTMDIQRKNPRIEVHQPESFVLIQLDQSLGSTVEWLTANFLLDIPTTEENRQENEEERRFEFISLRDKLGLIFEFHCGGCPHLASFTKNDEDLPTKRRERKESKVNIRKELYQESDTFFEVEGNDYSNFGDVHADDPENHGDDPDYDNFRALEVQMKPQTLIAIYTDSLELAGNCVQSLGEHFRIQNLPCIKANFPGEIQKLKQLVQQVEDIQAVRQHLVVEVADNANMIRAAVVQAEDARLTEEFLQMKQIYNDLAMLNRDIMREYKIRCQNHQDLVDNLKQINIIIQKASNLRIGTFKTTFITSCREAIKQKNFGQLYKIINED